MFAHPRMIGRALPGQIERDLEAEPRGLLPEGLEVVERAEAGLDGGVPASGDPIAHGLPGSRIRGQAVVRPFRKLVPIG